MAVSYLTIMIINNVSVKRGTTVIPLTPTIGLQWQHKLQQVQKCFNVKPYSWAMGIPCDRILFKVELSS